MRTADTAWISNVYPLIDRRMTRWDCLVWMERQGYPAPPKSSCIGCPFHNDRQWQTIQAVPEEWDNAVTFDAHIRRLPGVRGALYLHQSLRPLDQVDLRTDEERGQLSLFGNECSGYCGT